METSNDSGKEKVQQNQVTTSTKNFIPYNLFCLLAKDYHVIWGRETYKFYHIFNEDITSTAYKNDTEVLSWVQFALKLRQDLKELGLKEAKKEFVRAAVEDCLMKLPDGQVPTNVDDVLSIIGDKNWYGENTLAKQHKIYNLSFRIFMKGYNQWANKAVTAWMAKYNLEYDDSTQGKRRGKGCIYMLFLHSASAQISHRVQDTCKDNHGEYVAMRERKTSGEKSVTFHPVKFYDKSAYICCDETHNKMDVSNSEYKKLREKQILITRIEKAVELACRKGVTQKEIDDAVTRGVCVTVADGSVPEGKYTFLTGFSLFSM